MTSYGPSAPPYVPDYTAPQPRAAENWQPQPEAPAPQQPNRRRGRLVLLALSLALLLAGTVTFGLLWNREHRVAQSEIAKNHALVSQLSDVTSHLSDMTTQRDDAKAGEQQAQSQRDTALSQLSAANARIAQLQQAADTSPDAVLLRAAQGLNPSHTITLGNAQSLADSACRLVAAYPDAATGRAAAVDATVAAAGVDVARATTWVAAAMMDRCALYG